MHSGISTYNWKIEIEINGPHQSNKRLLKTIKAMESLKANGSSKVEYYRCGILQICTVHICFSTMYAYILSDHENMKIYIRVPKYF